MERVEAPEEEVPCPGCNELVRKGLVRCWNCGTFMQQDIAESYRRMQVSPPKVIYSEVSQTSDQDAGTFSGNVSDSGQLVDAPRVDADDEADFEVDGEMIDDGDEGDFDLGAPECARAPQ